MFDLNLTNFILSLIAFSSLIIHFSKSTKQTLTLFAINCLFIASYILTKGNELLFLIYSSTSFVTLSLLFLLAMKLPIANRVHKKSFYLITTSVLIAVFVSKEKVDTYVENYFIESQINVAQMLELHWQTILSISIFLISGAIVIFSTLKKSKKEIEQMEVRDGI